MGGRGGVGGGGGADAIHIFTRRRPRTDATDFVLDSCADINAPFSLSVFARQTWVEGAGKRGLDCVGKLRAMHYDQR